MTAREAVQRWERYYGCQRRDYDNGIDVPFCSVHGDEWLDEGCEVAVVKAAAEEGLRLLGLDQPLPPIIEQAIVGLVTERDA